MGLGAFGFFVGPALFDFLAFEGDFGLAATAEVAVLEEADFLSPAGDLLDLPVAAATWAAELFFSAAVFFAFGEVFLADLAAVAAAAVDLSAAAIRLAGDFLDLAVALFFLSPADGFAALDVAEANLNEPEAPFPFVCTKAPEATDAFRYFLMKGATFSASTL